MVAVMAGQVFKFLLIQQEAAAVLLLGFWFVSNGAFESQNPTTGEQAADARAFDGDSQTPPTRRPIPRAAPNPFRPARRPTSTPRPNRPTEDDHTK